MATDLSAILTALKTDPEAREAIRRELLTDELLALPARMEQLVVQMGALSAAQVRTEEKLAEVGTRLDRLAERMDQLTERMEQLAVRMDQLAVRIDQLAAQVEKMATAQSRTDERLARVEKQGDRLAGTFGDIKGTQYEAYVLRTPRTVAGAVGAAPGTLHAVSERDMEARLDAAVAAGLLSADAAEHISLANGVYLWQPTPGAPPVYCVVEVSLTAHLDAIERAVARAAALARTGVETRPVLLGAAVAPDARSAIKSNQVSWRLVPPKRGQRTQTS